MFIFVYIYFLTIKRSQVPIKIVLCSFSVGKSWPQEKIQDRLKGKNNLLSSQVLETGGTVCHKKDIRVVKRQEGQNGGKNLGYSLYWHFCRKGEAGQSKPFRIDKYEYIQQALSYRGSQWLLGTWP